MYNIIPLIIILFSLGVIITIVARKFSVLATIDLDTIQSEREIKVKERIIGDRIKRNFFKYYNKGVRIIKPLKAIVNNFFKLTYNRLLEFKENYNREKETTNEGFDDNILINKLFVEAGNCIKKEEMEEAEKKYIEIIKIDSKNTRAFLGLGKIYAARKDFNEAKQSFQHALKLKDGENKIYSDLDKQEIKNLDLELAKIYLELSLVNLSMDNTGEALKNINKALKIDSNNPRYLDTKLKISIINKDKISALDAYDKLIKTNPDNKKLFDFKKEISKL